MNLESQFNYESIRVWGRSWTELDAETWDSKLGHFKDLPFLPLRGLCGQARMRASYFLLHSAAVSGLPQA